MRPITLELNKKSKDPLYIQLYEYLKKEIAEGGIAEGERLPSLRKMAEELGISITTAEMAYSQLLVEGYVESRPQSGYYALKVGSGPARSAGPGPAGLGESVELSAGQEPRYRYDLASFNFVKWKKCMSAVLNDWPDRLLFESDPQGELALRQQISRYVFSSRGVDCRPEDIVIAAGTQQLTNHLARILRNMDIGHVALEDPGYLPVQNIFHDRGFTITKIPVAQDGIRIEKLPVNVPSAVYVCPSNQFPTGAVMPIGRRYELLRWARENQSIILEDDYDSELRYFGKPVSALQGLDESGECVVYLGSFSSTLFPAIKISYMVLPHRMAEIFQSFKGGYDQTCSKEEQLALALFMERGYYRTGIRRMRSLYASKLQACIAAFRRWAPNLVVPLNTHSGVNLILRVLTGGMSCAELGAGTLGNKAPADLCRLAADLRLQVLPMENLSEEAEGERTASDRSFTLIFYYNQIPLDEIDDAIRDMIESWCS